MVPVIVVSSFASPLLTNAIASSTVFWPKPSSFTEKFTPTVGAFEFQLVSLTVSTTLPFLVDVGYVIDVPRIVKSYVPSKLFVQSAASRSVVVTGTTPCD